MLIFHYASLVVLAIGAVVLVAGGACAVSYAALAGEPPRSEEEEARRNQLSGMAVTLVIVGVLMCGVGVLFN